MTAIKDLPIGAIFIHASHTYTVMGDIIHSGHNNPVRACYCNNCSADALQTLDVNIEVMQTGTAMKAEYYQQNPINKL